MDHSSTTTAVVCFRYGSFLYNYSGCSLDFFSWTLRVLARSNSLTASAGLALRSVKSRVSRVKFHLISSTSLSPLVSWLLLVVPLTQSGQPPPSVHHHIIVYLVLMTPVTAWQPFNTVVSSGDNFHIKFTTLVGVKLTSMYMLGTICGSAQSMYRTAQSMDPYFAQESMDRAG